MKFFIIYQIWSSVVPLITLLNFSYALFVIGLVGIVWNKRNILILLLCIELLFLCIGAIFIFLSVYTYETTGQIYCLLILTVVAGETAIGLSLLIISSRLGNKVNYNSLMTLRG
jgi:NADH-quinone oxidoreductase subunit K